MTAPYKTAEQWQREPQPAPSPLSTIPEPVMALIANGGQVFPCHSAPGGICSCGESCGSAGKHPWLKRWQEIASTDPELIERWLVRFRRCNWGVCCGIKSGIIILDVDGYHGGDETLAGHIAKHGPLPPTWRAKSGRDGDHFYFRHPGGFVKSMNDALGRGLDVKADGGFCIAPGSIHANGRPYRWHPDHHPDHEALADCPAWILEALAKHTPTTAAAAGKAAVSAEQWRERVEGEIFPGTRTQRITEVAGLMLRKNMEPHLILALLLGWNLRSFKPPLADQKIIKDVAGIMAREAARREKKNAA